MQNAKGHHGEFTIELLGTDPDWRFPVRGGSSRLVYHVGRRAEFQVNRRWYSLGSGDVLVVRAGQVSGEGTGEFIHVQFPVSLLNEVPDLFERGGRRGRKPKAVVVDVPRPHRETFENILISMFRERQHSLAGRHTVLRARMLDLLVLLYRARLGVVPHWQQNESMTSIIYRHRVRQVIHHATRHLEVRFTVKQLASMSGLNRTTFSRIHKTITGDSPIRLLERLRIAESQQLLGNTAHPVGEIASAVGYSDPSTFFRAFRRHVGTTPQAYREWAMGEKDTDSHG